MFRILETSMTDLHGPVSFGGGGSSSGRKGRNDTSRVNASRKRSSGSYDYNRNGTIRDEIALGAGVTASVAGGVASGWTGAGTAAAVAGATASISSYNWP